MNATSEIRAVPMSIKVYPVERPGALVAMASVVLDGCLRSATFALCVGARACLW